MIIRAVLSEKKREKKGGSVSFEPLPGSSKPIRDK